MKSKKVAKMTEMTKSTGLSYQVWRERNWVYLIMQNIADKLREEQMFLPFKIAKELSRALAQLPYQPGRARYEVYCTNDPSSACELLRLKSYIYSDGDSDEDLDWAFEHCTDIEPDSDLRNQISERLAWSFNQPQFVTMNGDYNEDTWEIDFSMPSIEEDVNFDICQPFVVIIESLQYFRIECGESDYASMTYKIVVYVPTEEILASVDDEGYILGKIEALCHAMAGDE